MALRRGHCGLLRTGVLGGRVVPVMSWAKVDDHLFMHPKFLGVSLPARGLWLGALSYAAGIERDGWFPSSALSMLAGGAKHDDLVRQLVHASLWVQDGDGYRLHNFLKYNRSRKQLKKQRKLTAKRVQALRARNGVTPALVTRLPARPDPSRPKKKRESASRQLPTTETLTPERLEMAQKLGLSAKAAGQEWAKLADHEFRDAHSNWDAVWRNWVRRAPEFTGSALSRARMVVPSSGPQTPSVKATQAILARLTLKDMPA